MTTAHAIELTGVGKRYVKLEEQAMLLRSLLPFAKPKRSDLWALRDVSLTVAPGETVGILGRNGAGKTTLLRLLAGVTRPTEGRVVVDGRVAPLISVGVGFNREMSGRENVFMNGMLLGLTPDDIAARFDAIVSFAELEDFVDVPVKFYSSGMFMRLGFSVAVHVEPQVLLIDEVLAVGDLAFQLKCLDRMRALQGTGTTILLVSHSVSAIRMLCPRAIVLRHGQLDFDGDAGDAVTHHYEVLSRETEQRAGEDGTAFVGGVTISDRRLEAADGSAVLHQHAPVHLRFRARFDRAVESPQVVFTAVSAEGIVAYQLLPAFGRTYRTVAAGEEVEVDVEFVNRLAGGTYQLQVTILSNDGREILHQDPTGVLAHVEARLGSVGIAELEAVARVDGVDVSTHESVKLRGLP